MVDDSFSSLASSSKGVHKFLRSELRVAGQYLDKQQVLLRALCLTDDGVVIMTANTDPRLPADASLFTHEALIAAIEEASHERGSGDVMNLFSDPIFPTGYQDFLRAVEDMSLNNSWESIRLICFGEFVLIRHGSYTSRGGVIYDNLNVHTLLNEAFAKREGTDQNKLMAAVPFGDASIHPTLRRSAYTGFHGGSREPRSDGEDRYAHIFARLATILASHEAVDPFIAEIDGGYILMFLTPDGRQDVLTVELQELTDTAEEGVAISKSGTANADVSIFCSPMRALGQYLDAHRARGVMVQNIDADKWIADFAGVNEQDRDVDAITRMQALVTISIPAADTPKFGLFKR